MISAAATAGYSDDARSRLWWWLLSVLSSDVELRDNDNDDEDDSHHCNMTGRGSISSTAKLALVLLLILGSVLSTCNAKISDKRLCYDEDCSVVVSEGRTVIPYNSKDHDVLSFPLNAEVKIYSKAAGKRTDLWGVEIRGQRGYAPSKFIREHRILHSKLNYTVPTEESYNKDVKNVVHTTKNLKEINEEINHVVSNKEEEDNNQTTISEDVPKENLEINPHQVSPSYDIYDGTVIPKEYEEVEQPNYSTQTVQASVKEEEVQLNVYPNLLKSTFSAIKGMLSNTDENSKEIFDIETVEKATEIKETDESSFTSEEKQNEIKKDTASEDIPEDVTEEKKLQEYENINNNKINSSTPPEVTGTVSEKKINEEDSAIKSSKEAANVEIVDESNENKEEVIDPIDSVQQIDVEKPVEVRADKISKTNTVDEVESVSDSLQNDVVPKQEETETVTNNNSGSIENALGAESVPVAAAEETILDRQEVDVNATSVNSLIVSDSNENISGAENVVIASVEETILYKQEVDVNATSVDSKNVEDSITPEVPLKQEVQEESVATPKEPFLPEENSFQPNLSKNESTPIQNDIETDDNLTMSNVFVEKTNVINNSLNLEDQLEILDNIGDSNNNVNDDSIYTTSIPTNLNVSAVEDSSLKSTDSIQEPTVDIPATSSFGEFLGNRNLLNTEQDSEEIEVAKVNIDETIQTTTAPDSDENISSKVNQEEENTSYQEAPPSILPPETCDKMYDCSSEYAGHKYYANENAVTNARKPAHSSETLLYVCITAVTTLLFSLGYYFIENKRRDAYLIGKINNLEKDLMITRKECIMLDENFKSTKTKLDSIEDESFGSNEMVLSLKAELVASETTRAELEEQIASLEKELESTSEAGLELERMLREILSSHSEENNPLAQSIEDLQDRLNNQQIANESLTNALAARTQENETLTGDLTVSLKKVEQLQAEVTKLSHELKTQMNAKIELEQTLSDQVQRLELQVKSIAEDKSHLRKQLKLKELEVKELLTVVEQINLNNLDFEKLYEVSQIKAEAAHLFEERNELKIKLSEEEGAHQLLEEHVKLVKEEVSLLSEQCKLAEKEKKDAETRLEVLTRFFEEKEAQRQKEEAVWLEKQGEVSSTVERIQTMQNEILNYKQQIEMLKREILDQEREYKNQISTLETKAHEHWVAARQHERRLEEIKVESSQLRNRLTIVEKNINDGDPEIKLHRLQGANGDESSSSPLMFAGSGPPPLPPPSYLYGSPGSFAPPPPFLPPPLSGPGELVGSRPPPLGGGRLSSPPPTGPSGNATSGGHNPAGSPPPLSPPPPLMPYLTHHHIRDHHQHHPLHRHRSPPPLPPFEVPPPPLPLHHHHHMPPPPPGSGWGDEPLPPLRNSSGFQLHQRDQRARNHKDSLHSSGESLDKSHHGGKA